MKTQVEQYWLRLSGQPIVDLPSGVEDKDVGIEEVRAHNEDWMDFAIVSAESYLYNAPAEFTGEDIRLHVEPRAGTPSSCNAWGALINTLARRGLIEKTGRYVKMTIRSSHARIGPVYRRK